MIQINLRRQYDATEKVLFVHALRLLWTQRKIRSNPLNGNLVEICSREMCRKWIRIK